MEKEKSHDINSDKNSRLVSGHARPQGSIKNGRLFFYNNVDQFNTKLPDSISFHIKEESFLYTARSKEEFIGNLLIVAFNINL